MRHPWAVLGMALALSFLAAGAHAQQAQPAPGAGPAATAGQDVPRDPFFWLGEINKASAVINTDAGLLDKSMAPRLAAGVAKVIEDAGQPGPQRPATVITFDSDRKSVV